MSDTKQMLQRARERFVPPGDVMESLMRRRQKKERNRRISAAVLAIVLTLLSITGLMRAFRNSERPAIEPTPTPVDTGIFSGIGGWIAYADTDGIWAVDPSRPGDARIQLSQETLSCRGCRPDPVAWSSDGSKLLISRKRVIRGPQAGGAHWARDLFVLNADGTEARLTDGDHDWITGGSFSPDGTKVVYSDEGSTGRSAIYAVDAAGGTPQVLVTARWGRRLRRAAYPAFSPDGSQIAFVGGFGGPGTVFMVMNADGSDPRVLLHDETFQGAGHIYSLVWSPDGTRLAFDSDEAFGIYTFGADGSGLTLVVPGGRHPYWSPDGSRISFDLDYRGTTGIADADGTHVQGFGGATARSGPWNPLSEASSDVAPPASARPTVATRLLLLTMVLALAAGVVIIRHRMRKTRGA